MKEDVRVVVGRLGGLVKNPDKGFGSNAELSKVAGKKGGMVSRRGADFASHQRNLDNLFHTWHLKDWADIFWAFEPQFEDMEDDEGHKKLGIVNFEQLTDTVIEQLTTIYVEDYIEDFAPVSDKMWERIHRHIKEFVSEIMWNINDQLLEDEKDYEDTIDDWRQTYYDLVHPE